MRTTTLDSPVHGKEWLNDVKIETAPAKTHHPVIFHHPMERRVEAERKVEELLNAHALYWSERKRYPRLEDFPQHSSEWLVRRAWGTNHSNEVETEKVKQMTYLMKMSTLEMIIDQFCSKPINDPSTGIQTGWDHRFFDITPVLSQYIGEREVHLREALSYAKVLKNLPQLSRVLVLEDVRLSHPSFDRDDLSLLVGRDRLVAEALVEMVATLLYGTVDERRHYNGIEDRGINTPLSPAIVEAVMTDRQRAMELFRNGHSAGSIVAAITNNCKPALATGWL